MGTKNNPGAYDCYANADPDEPLFVLLGRDPMAGALVRIWAVLRRLKGETPGKVEEAMKCAEQMDAWAASLGKEPSAFCRLRTAIRRGWRYHCGIALTSDAFPEIEFVVSTDGKH